MKKFCINCGTPKPEPETKQEAESVEEQASGGFAFTTDGDIGESSTKENCTGRSYQKNFRLGSKTW